MLGHLRSVRQFMRFPPTQIRCRSSQDNAEGNGMSYEQPRPYPLGNAEDQQEFENLLRQFSIVSEQIAKNDKDSSDEDPNIDSTGRNKLTGEINGPRGCEPTRFGDWERKGRTSDF